MDEKSVNDTDSGEWEVELINGYLALGATFVGDAAYQHRVDTCRTCPKFGKVRLPFGTLVEGCTVCGCPTATKPKVDRYFHPIKFKNITVDCPEGRWPVITNL